MRLVQEPALANNSILIIEQDAKQVNDRTWCFWEQSVGFFDEIVYHRWNELLFHSDTETIPLQIQPYQYKMIRGIDFYNYCKQKLQQYKQITWLQATVVDCVMLQQQATVNTTIGNFTADYVFNSILLPATKALFNQTPAIKLVQHFKGWIIETPEPIFNPNKAYFMDFRVGQENGTTFVYVLPFSSTKALVEYTFFNEAILPDEAYDNLLTQYLKTYWQLTNYTILETEFGVIPMTNFPFSSHQQSIIHLGTVGGYTKPSSGFTFQFIQKHTQAITQALVHNYSPIINTSFWQKRFFLYDATLLHVLSKNALMGRQVFTALFQKQKATTILKFLDNETNFKEELFILNSVPTKVFLPAAFIAFFQSLKLSIITKK
jgi:lycopene beta-cyclase